MSRMSRDGPSKEQWKRSPSRRNPFCILFFAFLFTLYSSIFPFHSVDAAPAVCRACNKNCSAHYGNLTINRLLQNDTTSIILSFDQSDEIENWNETRRVRRSTEAAGVTRKPCERFNIELILIPLCVAMIPIGLCALLLCTCCCGPKDSRGKLPDNFLKTIASSASLGKRCTSEEMELEYRDGYVQRKDSTKTKFSTVVSYIEPTRRSSVWSIRTNASVEGSQQGSECGDDRGEDSSIQPKRIAKSSSSGSMVRFSEQVSVLGVDELTTGKR